MRRFLIIMAPILVIGLGIGGLVILHATKPEPEKSAASEERPAALYVADVRYEPVTLSVKTQGTVESQTEIDLMPQVSGRIVKVAPAFAGGGIFKAGETLIQLEDDDYRYAVTQARSRVADANLVLAQEEARAQVARKQWDWDEITDKPTALALKVPHVAQARASLAAAEADLARAQRDLARTQISVPFSGRVREKHADIGQFVTAGTRLGRVFSTETVEIRLPLTDQQLAEVGLPIAYAAESYDAAPEVTLTALLAGKTRQWIGHIVRTDAAIDRETRLFYAIARVRDPYGSGASEGVPLPVGLFVTASIDGRSIENAYIIPRSALRGEKSVYVVGDDNRLSIRTVEVLSADADRVILSAGVEAGDRVVTSPVRNARNGMPVEPLRREDSARVAQVGD